MKIAADNMKYSYFLCLIVLAFIINGCKENDDILPKEQISSPDQKYTAFSETHLQGGAAGSISDLVFIRQNYGNDTEKHLVFKSLRTKELKLHWTTSNVLLIEYKDADIIEFHNKLFYDYLKNDYLVEIVLERVF